MSNEVKIFEHVDGLDTYFSDVQKYKRRLTRKEEKELAMRIKKGDKEALDTLVKHNLRFVILIAKKYRALTDVSFADLISEGNIGLIKAAQRFDPSRNVKFSSCAIWWIKSAINDCIEEYRGNVEYNAVDDSQIENVTENDLVYNEVNEEFERKMNNLHSRQSAIDELVQCLEERERNIIMLFYGLGEEGHELNLEEIGQKMHITTERVRQIKDNALVKMRCEALCSDEFETYRDLR